MSRWTHNACYACWTRLYPGDRQPFRLIDAETEKCCFCGASNRDGIYVRHDPADADLACGGQCIGGPGG